MRNKPINIGGFCLWDKEDKAISKNWFAYGLWFFSRKISTFFWLSIAGYAIEKEIERFQ